MSLKIVKNDLIGLRIELRKRMKYFKNLVAPLSPTPILKHE